MRIAGIYSITSPTGKIYIGQSWDINTRLRRHKSGGERACTGINRSILKHGWLSHNFKILHELPQDADQKIMDQFEIFYIEQYREAGLRLLNIREGGGNGKMSEESKLKIGLSGTGRKHSEETKLKMSLAKRGVAKSLKHRENLSKAANKRWGNGN